MECASSGFSKLHYGSALAAALAHLALKQQDAVGIILFADEVVAHLPPKAKSHQLDEILRLIASTRARPVSDAGRALHQAAGLARHRGMVVVISDLFDDLTRIMDGFDHLRFLNHEVLLFHIFDRYERDLPLEGNIRFRDLETGEELTTQADGIREKYLEAIGQWRAEVERECRNRSIDRVELTTDDKLDEALLDYLVRRSKSF
jgi:uncharacterized protein (DUF58 family)